MDEQLPKTTQDMLVLFADVSGSTRLYEALGDERAFSAISQCIAVLRSVAEEFEGRVVKTIGDEIMVVFPCVLSGIQAACAMQTEVGAITPVENNIHLAIRIGLHFGPVLIQSGNSDVFGDTVNVAARLTEWANAGQIISSDTTIAVLPPLLRTSTRALDATPIKGKSSNIKVVEVLWQESVDETLMVGRTQPSIHVASSLRLKHGNVEVVVNAARKKIVLGRDELADFMVADKRASRLHATIELRRDKFVFMDHSSNGSYITFNDENELRLRREEVALRGSGIICLGHSLSKDAEGAISFSCESE